MYNSPGLNGIASGHKEITQDQIAKSSAGIFLFSADKPGSQTDFEILGELQNKIQNVILVLNKIDNIKETEGEDINSVVNKLKENYKKVFPEAKTIPEIWPVVAYPALVARSKMPMDYHGKTEFSDEEREKFEKDSRMVEFEDRLWKFLAHGEKAKQELLSPVVHLINQLSAIKERHNNELAVLTGSVDQSEIEAKQIELENILESLKKKEKDDTKDVRGEIRTAEDEFKKSIESECERIKKEMFRKIDNFTDVEEINSEKLERKVKNKLFSAVSSAYDDYKDRLREIVATRTSEILNIDESDPSSSIQITLDTTLNLTDVKVGLEYYEKQQDEVQKEIKELSSEVRNAEIEKQKQEKLAIKLAKKERELENLKEKRDMFMEMRMSNRPSITSNIVNTYEEIPPTGLFGHIGRVFKGAEYRPTQEIKINDSELKQYKLETERMLKEYDSKIQKMEQEYEKLTSKSESEDCWEAESLLRQKNQLLSQKFAEQERKSKEFAEKVRATCQKQLRRQKDDIEDFTDELCKNCTNKAIDAFRTNRKNLTQIVLDLIVGTVTEQIKTKQQELQHLNNQSQKAVEERDKKISDIENENQQINELLMKVTDLQSEIESIRTDVIKQDKLEEEP